MIMLISEIVLEWPQSDDFDANSGSITLTVLNDIGRLRMAVESLVEQSDIGLSDSLTNEAFRRSALLPPLLIFLGMAPLAWCCLDDDKFPPVQIVGQ